MDRTSSAIGEPWALLQPRVCPPRLEQVTVLKPWETRKDLSYLVKDRPDPTAVMALDFETKGDWMDADSYPVGVALSDSRGSIYISFQHSPDAYSRLMHLLMEAQVPLIAHNVFFDSGWPLRDFGLWLNWKACTYSMLRLLATEGWLGQEWGLKAAQKSLLGWQETNEAKLDTWLIDNGYISSTSKTDKPGWYPDAEGSRWHTPKKAEMWRAPDSILGHYSALDADACWLLYYNVLHPALARFDALKEYIYSLYMPYMHILVQQKLDGICIDVEKLKAYKEKLIGQIAVASNEILEHPTVKPHITKYNAEYIQQVAITEPPKFLKPAKLGAEPAQLTKAGKPSKSWEAWAAKRDRVNGPPKLSANWLNWNSRMALAKITQRFNLGSNKQLIWLLYECIGFPQEILTKKGTPATDEDALLGMGEVGRLLLARNDLEKMLEFCDQTLGLLTPAGTIHPGFLVPGTLTGRLSGKRPNIQQAPKVGEYLECWVPRSGKVWVDCDHAALEPVVMAELSRDPGLMAVYGPDSPPNDVYLFVGANLPGSIGASIRAAGYDPLAPTKAAIAKAKAEAKGARSIAKNVKLACDYGAGPGKLQFTLKVRGTPITMQQAEDIHSSFWDIFAGIKRWEAELKRQWRMNRKGGSGWVLNGIGRPLGVWEDKLKDLVNRVCQSTGHDIHVKYLLIVHQLLQESNIPFTWIIADFHDESIVECNPEDAPAIKHLMGVKAYEILNQWLDGMIPLKGTAEVVHNLAEAKVEGWASKSGKM